MISDNKIMTVPELAELLRIGRSNAYELVKSEGFPAVKIKKQIRIPVAEFEKWLSGQANIA